MLKYGLLENNRCYWWAIFDGDLFVDYMDRIFFYFTKKTEKNPNDL